MKKFICILLAFAMAAFFGCSKDDVTETETTTSVADVQYPVDNNSETQTVISGIDIDPETDQHLCSVPLMPTDSESIMLRSAYRAMNEKFGGATVENQEVLELGGIYGEPCRRFHIETSKGDFVAVVNESGEVLSTWSEGEEKTTDFRFPQLCDINIASDENLMVAYYNFYGGGYHDEAVIYDFEQEVITGADGKPLWKVVLYTTHCTSTFWIDVFGTVVDRTK